MSSQPVRLLLNGRLREIRDLAPTTTLLDWLRGAQGLVGTKEGCAEGDCGACTIVIGECVGPQRELRLTSVNACIQFVPACDGKAVFTVEYLRQQCNGALHPAQQAMVDCHGSQCGFCTPGFVMSLWGHYHHRQASPNESPDPLTDVLSGNLCRCTGYRPILDAGRQMFELPAVALNDTAIREALGTLERDQPLDYRSAEGRFVAPHTPEQLAHLRAEDPAATLLAGCTDIGLWVTKQLRPLPSLIYLGRVEALKRITVRDQSLVIGAAVSLEDAFRALTHHYPELRSIWKRFAGLPVRNAGTLGGNLANGSPIGDSMPALIALGASVVLASRRGERRLALEAFYLDYMRNDLAADEYLAAVEVPLPTAWQVMRSYKVSKRHDCDISAVCAGFALTLEDGVIRQPRVAYGGMAATVRRAPCAEQALDGRQWDEATLNRAVAALAEDYTPLSDLRATAHYRNRVAAGLLRRFFLETQPGTALTEAQTSVFATLAEAGA